jgi:hypothetical protein
MLLIYPLLLECALPELQNHLAAFDFNLGFFSNLNPVTF